MKMAAAHQDLHRSNNLARMGRRSEMPQMSAPSHQEVHDAIQDAYHILDENTPDSEAADDDVKLDVAQEEDALKGTPLF